MSLSNFRFLTELTLCLLFIQFISCKEQPVQSPTVEVDEIVVRMLGEPQSISPILATTSVAREVYQYIFVTLADYDYETLELKPILLEEIPESIISDDGLEIRLDMKIKDEAEWGDGLPITGHDVHTTLKLALNPSIPSRGWKSLLGDVISVEVDPDNPKEFSIRMQNSLFLNREALLSAEIYPAHIYDAEQILENVEIANYKDEEWLNEMTKDSSFQNLATNFSSIKWSKETAEGGGPYVLESWNTGQFIVLKRKPNYWGNQFGDLDQLESVAERIIFRFIRDEATALTLLKNDELDLSDLTRSSFKQYDDLKADTSFSKEHDFHTTQLPRYYFLLMNNEDVRLADLAVRKAIAHLVNVEQMIDQIEGGYAKRINSVIHFTKREYREDLAYVDYDPELANELLDNAGWVDSDGDKIRDKVVNGRKEDLSLRFHISGSNLSSSVSAIIKEGCAKGGINVEIITKPNSATMTENIRPGDYEFYLTQRTQIPFSYDPYNSFHSSAVSAGGLNYMRYSNEEADELIVAIREAKDDQERKKTYDEFQALINEHLPVILLYSPQQRIITSNDIQPVISTKRPGFFVNATEEL